MNSKTDLTQLVTGTELLRQIRYMPDTAFDDVTDDELTTAIFWLRAARYSCTEGARKLERTLAKRQGQDTEETDGE